MTHPALPERAAAWQLRAAWATGREVVLALPPRHGGRARGYVQAVASTNAFALLWDGAGLVHVPCALVRAVRAPHFHEDDLDAVEQPPRPRVLEVPRVHPGQLALPVGLGRRERELRAALANARDS